MMMAQPSSAVTYEQLLNEMIDLDRLAEFPSETYHGKMSSSYDRRATDPFLMDATNWTSNDDFVETGKWDQLVAVEERNGEKEFVLMDVEGPGVIQRIWFAQGGNAGNIRIYLDGQPEPVIDMPVDEIIKAGEFPFLAPIANIRAEGYNSNLPISYSSHCRVAVTRADERYWYQISYRAYEAGTRVESYSPALADRHADQIRKVAQVLADPMSIELPTGKTAREVGALAPAASMNVMVQATDSAVYQMRIRVDAEEIEKALRSTVLEISFDGTRTVFTPVGDFFGSAPGLNPHTSLATAVREDGMLTARWIMPFRSSVQVKIGNYGEQDIRVAVELLTAPRAWTEQTMYFHAGWFNTGEINSMPRRDINFIALAGRGRYLGNMMSIANWNRDWWGEGDEKIWVDDEAFPGIFGTGVEDYYGYAVCSRKLFEHPYHNQTRCDGPGNSGNTSLARFHIFDDLPFNTAFRFDMGIWHWDTSIIEKSITSWWYAFPGTHDNLPRLNTSMLRLPNLPPPGERVGRNLFPND